MFFPQPLKHVRLRHVRFDRKPPEYRGILWSPLLAIPGFLRGFDIVRFIRDVGVRNRNVSRYQPFFADQTPRNCRLSLTSKPRS